MRCTCVCKEFGDVGHGLEVHYTRTVFVQVPPYLEEFRTLPQRLVRGGDGTQRSMGAGKGREKM